jgi:hypothetical protein
MLAQHAQHLVAVANATDDERTIEHGLTKPRGQIVQHDHALAARPQLQNDMTANVACAAGD